MYWSGETQQSSDHYLLEAKHIQAFEDMVLAGVQLDSSCSFDSLIKEPDVCGDFGRLVHFVRLLY